MTLVLTAIATMLCKDMALILQVQQGPVVMVATQDDAATLATVTTVRTAIGVILDMAKVHRPSPALARTTEYLDVIYEIRFHQSPFVYR